MDVVARAVGTHQTACAQVGLDQCVRQPGQAEALAGHRVQGIDVIANDVKKWKNVAADAKIQLDQ
nr:hypothetical protein [Achromobacter sp. UMC71]